jgi:KDO2-lipid IV(A) lauroyltransferase
MRFMRSAGGACAALPMNRKRLHRAVENLSWCFPEWPADLVRDYAVEAYRHLFCLAAELMLSPRLLNEDGFARHVELGRLREGLLALASERPCILITGHCGNWELLGATLAMLGFPMHALYRPLDLAPLDAWLHETRSRQGVLLVDKFNAAETLPALLERKQPVGFIADQNAGDRGLFVPFFNRLASAYKTIGLLAIRYRATVVCGHAMRLSGLSASSRGAPTHEAREAQSFRYRVDVIDLFGPDEWESQPDPLFYITARYRRAIEQMVRRAPEQYLWMHRYWKSRPPHERRAKDFPAQLREKIASLPWIDDDDVAQIVERSNRDARALQASA